MTHQEWVQRVLDEAPPLSEDQKDLLRRAFFEAYDKMQAEEQSAHSHVNNPTVNRKQRTTNR